MSSTTTGSAFERHVSTAEKYTQRLRFGWRRKVPVVLQSGRNESGLACLAMVIGYHGGLAGLAELRTRFSSSLDDMSPDALLDIGAELHLHGDLRRVPRSALRTLRLPCVLEWAPDHFVVLTRVRSGRSGIVIHDPAVGEMRIRRSEVVRRFSSVTVLHFGPTDEFKSPQSPRPAGVSWMTGPIVGLKRSLAQIVVLALSLQVLVLALPLAVQWAVDSGIGFADRELLGTLAIGAGALLLGLGAIGALRSWMVMYMLSHIGVQWLTNAFTHLLRLPVHHFHQRELGQVASSFQSIQRVQGLLGTQLVEGLVDGLMAFAVLALMCGYSVALTLCVVVAAALYAVARGMLWPRQKVALQQELALNAKENAVFLETVQNMPSIKLYGREPERRAYWLDAVVESMNRVIAQRTLALGLRGLRALLIGAETVVVIWLASLLVAGGQMSLGMLVAFVAYKALLSSRLFGLIDRVVELKLLGLQAERLADVALTPAETSGAGSSLLRHAPSDMTLELRGVWFRYHDGGPWVLEDVHLVFAPGEAVAIVGASGSGKSTLVKLMLGLIEPTRGEVRLGGVPIQQLGMRDYRRQIGAVLQEDHLLAGTLLDNISFFSDRPRLDRVVEATAAAAIHEEIERMPLGYHTPLIGMGGSLSSGQKQRILLARALYRRPKLLILDEATSHVDLKREAHIVESLGQMQATRIVVAHRPDAVRHVSRVVVVENRTIAKDLSSVIPAAADAVTLPHESRAALPVLNNVVSLQR